MYLYFLDDEAENPLVARVPLDFDYMAEQYVADFAEGREGGTRRPLITFILCDAEGIRCVWTRSVEDALAKKLPVITKVTARFTGEWVRSVEPVPRIEAVDPYELAAHSVHFSA